MSSSACFRWAPPAGRRIVIDASNPLEFLAPGAPERSDPGNPFAAFGVKLADLGGQVSSEIVAELVPGARLVKTFNHFGVELLVEPQAAGGQRVLFYSGDDADAKADVGKLIETLGFFPMDLGPLSVGAVQTTPLGPLSMTNLVKIWRRRRPGRGQGRTDLQPGPPRSSSTVRKVSVWPATSAQSASITRQSRRASRRNSISPASAWDLAAEALASSASARSFAARAAISSFFSRPGRLSRSSRCCMDWAISASASSRIVDPARYGRGIHE